MRDPYGLQRFIDAQHPVLPQVEAELRAGAKRTHWMWFIFPQLAGLGHSPIARHYALGSIAEAKAYLAHPILGQRLIGHTELVLAVSNRSAQEMFGSPDDLKLRSCMTLFNSVSPSAAVFSRVLDQFFSGDPDLRTLALLAAA